MRTTLLIVDKGVHSGIRHSMNLNINFITNDNISFILCVISKLFVYIKSWRKVSLIWSAAVWILICRDTLFILIVTLYLNILILLLKKFCISNDHAFSMNASWFIFLLMALSLLVSLILFCIQLIQDAHLLKPAYGSWNNSTATVIHVYESWFCQTLSLL